MDMRQPSVSVIIPVYDNLDGLKKCLAALDNQTYDKARYEIIVIGNNSRYKIDREISFPKNVSFIYEKKRGSYAARNKGIVFSSGEILAFTDSDCIPQSNWIEQGVRNLLSVDNCGILGGKIEIFVKDPSNPTCIELLELYKAFNQIKYITKKHFAATANLFTFKSVFKKVGFFNERLQSSGDFEWGNRVHSAGYTLIFNDDVVVLHPARRTFMQIVKKKVRIIKGLKDAGLSPPYSLLKFIVRVFYPFAALKRMYNHIIKNNIKSKKIKIKLIIAIVFEYYISHFIRLGLYLFRI